MADKTAIMQNAGYMHFFFKLGLNIHVINIHVIHGGMSLRFPGYLAGEAWMRYDLLSETVIVMGKIKLCRIESRAGSDVCRLNWSIRLLRGRW